MIKKQKNDLESVVSDHQDENQNDTQNAENSATIPEDGEFHDSIDSSNTSTENKVAAGSPEVFKQISQRLDQPRMIAIAQHVQENAHLTESVTTKLAAQLRICR